jgi:sulfonate transport system substrate-binding protein
VIRHILERKRWASSRRALITISSIALLALSACGTSTSATSAAAGQGGQEFTLRIGMTAPSGVRSGNIGWGYDKGTLLKALGSAGVSKIEVALFQAGPLVQAALASGAIDVAVTGDMPALQTRGNGTPVRQIGFSNINADTWLVGRKDGPTTVAGLVGKKVAAPSGTIRFRFLYGLLVESGLQDKIDISDLGTPESIAALKTGSIDALSISPPQNAQLQSQGYTVIAKASEHPALLSTEQTVALQSFIDKHPGFTKAWGQALVDTNSDIRANIDAYWAYQAKVEHVPVAVEKVAEPVDNYNTEPFPAAGVKQLRSTYEFLKSQNLIKNDFDFDAWFQRS